MMIRKIASQLNNLPKTKRFLKNIYQRVGNIASDGKSTPPDIVQISPSSSEHLFGYYDKSPWNIDESLMIFLEVHNANKNSASMSTANIMLKSKNDHHPLAIAKTNAWNVQQGCMLQWIGKHKNQIIFNDLNEGRLHSVKLNVDDGYTKMIDFPIYSLASNGIDSVSLDFERLQFLRPGYGYNINNIQKIMLKCPDTPCVWHVNIETNISTALFSYAELASIKPQESMKDAFHKVNHLMLSPNGDRFIFLHRWTNKGRKYDRLLMASKNKGIYPTILLDEGMVSHSCWRDDHTILTFANTEENGPGYYIIDVDSKEITSLIDFFPKYDGHPSYSPNKKFVITDSYPDFQRKQHIYLVDMITKRARNIAELYAPIKYKNEMRCDLHPRWSPSGTKICFDSSKDGLRQVYVLDVRKFVES